MKDEWVRLQMRRVDLVDKEMAGMIERVMEG